jgi:dihydropteroate synthase
MYCEFLEKKFNVNTDKNKNCLCFGILNLTPDSFSDGNNNFDQLEYQKAKIAELINLSVDVIDLGAESTRPYANAVNDSEEIKRLDFFLEHYNAKLPLSLDTRKTKVLENLFFTNTLKTKNNQIFKYINDVSGMQNQEFVELCSQLNPEIQFIAMHSKGDIPPKFSSKDLPNNFYEEDQGLEKHFLKFFEKTISNCEKFNISKDRLILDPGFGFAKNFQQSFELIKLIPKIKKEFKTKIFIGSSRKGFLRLWQEQITKLNIDANALSNKELDQLTIAFNELLTDIDYFRMHGL